MYLRVGVLMGRPGLFRYFQTILQKKLVGIRTRIVRVEGKHANHLYQWLWYFQCASNSKADTYL